MAVIVLHVEGVVVLQSFEFILLSPVRQYFIPPSPLMYMKILPLLHGILLPKAYILQTYTWSCCSLQRCLMLKTYIWSCCSLQRCLMLMLSNAQDLHLVLLFPVAQSNAA